MPTNTNKPVVTKKGIYMAKDIDDLNSKAHIEKFGRKSIERIIEYSDKFYLKARSAQADGDEECAYFFYFRFMELFQMISNAEEKKTYSRRNATRLKEVMDELDKLSDNLQQRYKEKRESYEKRRSQFFEDSSNRSSPVHNFPGTSVRVVDESSSSNQKVAIDDEDENELSYSIMECCELIKCIQSSSSNQINKVLIIDIRSAEDYAYSCIMANKLHTNGQVNFVNIPEHIVAPALSFPALRKQLKLGLAMDAFERRRSMDKVVIMDWKSNHFDEHSKCVILANALWKWDASPDRIKFKPYLLKGGYYEFVLTYPMFVTNPNVINAIDTSHVDMRFKSVLSKKTFNFDEYGNEIQESDDEDEKEAEQEDEAMSSDVEPSTLPANPMIPPMMMNGNLSSSTTSTTSISYPKLNAMGAGGQNGLVKPTMLSSMVPDRSTKPISLTTNLNGELVSRNGFKRERPLPGHLVMERVEPMEEEDELVAGNFDDLKLNNFPSQNGQMESESGSEVEEEENQDGEGVVSIADVGDQTSSFRTPTKPILVNRPASSSGYGSLSRSLSSPNIAGLEDEESPIAGLSAPNFGQQQQQANKIRSPLFSSTNTPLIDRSVKPSSLMSSSPAYQHLLRKPRDFAPQYSSCRGIVGLRNLGNTCFMNAVLQCLNNTNELVAHFHKHPVHINSVSKFGSNGELAVELMELFKQMSFPSNYKHISPRDLKVAVSRHIPDFIDYKQQDAHEFLVRFLDRVHGDLNRNEGRQTGPDPAYQDPNYYDRLPLNVAANKFWTSHMARNRSIITELFEGLLINTLTCLHCSYTSKALEAFTCLSVPLASMGRTSLKASLDLFMKRERLSDETNWQCPDCREMRDAERCTYIWRLPKILIIHFKRFSYDGRWRQKINSFVDFPLENLVIPSSGAQNEQRSYSLYGIVNHSGTLEGGHYTAYSRNTQLNIGWQKYDDQDVSAVTAADVTTQNAYVLFYRAADVLKSGL